jgi:phage-related baseplate assembly protein
MVARFLAPDLTQLSPAALIEEIDAEVILAAQKAFVLARWEEVRQTRPDLPALDTLGLETEPMTMLLETFAYRETLLRALVNDKARAVLLAYATGTDLDHLGALFATYRMVMVPASDGVEAVMETDDRFRRRIQLAPEAFSCAGPRGAYVYFALTLDPSIVDAHAFCPSDGRVDVMVAAADGALAFRADPIRC